MSLRATPMVTTTSSTTTSVNPPRKLHIYVARHGQDEDNTKGILNGHRDQPLTELGKQQAAAVATKIQNYRDKENGKLFFDAVYSSPLQRAYKTAEILISSCYDDTKNKSRPEIHILPDLIERNFGIMTGLPITEIQSKCTPDIIQTDTICYFLCPDGAETFPMLMARAQRLLEQLYEKHNNTSDNDDDDNTETTNILLVTHGDFGKMIYAQYYKLDWQDVLQQFHFGNSEILLLSQDITSPPDGVFVFQVEQHNA